MITPRQTRLVRVPDLHAFRRAIASLVIHRFPSADRDPLVVVPTRGAARQLVRVFEDAIRGDHEEREGGRRGHGGDIRAAAGADVVTRDELYDRLHAALGEAPRRLTALERDVLMQRASREAAAVAPDLPFRLRPGLVAEMLRFHDHLRRQSQQVTRFEELMIDALGRDDDGDRGARRLRDQTRFLATAFRAYEQAVRESGAVDEHLLRERLVSQAAPHPIRHIVVTVPDWIADAKGLYVADFELLARVPGLEHVDIVSTEGLLGSGFHERLHQWWPGIEEIPASGLDPLSNSHLKPPRMSARPAIVAPVNARPDEPWWTFRDREEELVSIARRIKADRRNGAGMRLDLRAVVFKAPLPYLYLAAEVFPAAGIPYQASDALPLAVEPSAAALDLVLDAVTSRFARNAIVSLLRSPHFAFTHDGREISRQSIAALNAALSRRQYLGDLERLQELAADWTPGHEDAVPALHAGLDAARELAPLIEPNSASVQVRRLQSFWDAHVRASDVSTAEDAEVGQAQSAARAGSIRARERRARTAIAQTLSALAAVHEACDDPLWTIDELALNVRRALEDQTFEPDSSSRGIQLLDDRAARYGDFDEVAIVGVVESEWPERLRRNIFYPSALLKTLGWPSEKDRRAASEAKFLELLASASRETFISTFTLDDDALVSRSSELDEIPRARLSTIARGPVDDARVFLDEALSLQPPVLEPFEGIARAWAVLRLGRSPADAPQFHGQVGRVGPRSPLTVSALETYLECPFKFFAQHVLKLEDEPDDEEVMDPKRQGRFMHGVFERFFQSWQAAGQRAITPENLDRAREMFAAIVDRALEQLPPAEAGLERTRLLGSPAAAGLGEAVLRMEAERPVPVVERLLEHDLRGEFSFATRDGPRTIALRGKADRMDLLEDGTFRLIDYKLGWPPNRARALQLPIYGVCAEQHFARHRGGGWRLGEAVYLAFKGPRRVVPLFSSGGDRVKVLGDAQQRLVETVDAIARADFPPAPDDVWRCETCSFSSVCRKDYVGDV